MGKESESKTEREVWAEEALFGLDGHYKTTISDDTEKAEGRGWTSEESQRNASEKWQRGETKSKSGCYLTTACIETMGLPDDCLELNVLRNFRDKILMQEPAYKRAVREYYRIAPEIVQAIEGQDNSQKIWRDIYGDIRHAVSLILSNDFEGAFKHYQQMTSRLKEKYLD